MKMEEILAKTPEELQRLKVDLSKDIFDLRNEKKIAQRLEKPHLIGAKRRQIARIETALRQKRITPIEPAVEKKEIKKEVKKAAPAKKVAKKTETTKKSVKKSVKKKEETNE